MEENIPKDEDKSYTQGFQQMQDIFKLSSIALILIVWTIVSFIAHQNKQLKEKISQTATTPSPIVNQVPNGNLANLSRDEDLRDWKTYTGKNYTLRYPPDWEISQGYVDLENTIMISNKKEGNEQIWGFIGEGVNFGIEAKLEAQKERIGNYVWNVRYSVCCTGYIDKKGQIIQTMRRLYTIGDINKEINFTFSFTLPKQFPKTYSIIDQILSTFQFLE